MSGETPYRTAQEARVGQSLAEQLREEIFRMRGKRAFLFQAAADRIDLLEGELSAALARAEASEKVLRAALPYVKHCGANQVMRGEPHPQQWLVDKMQAAIDAASAGEKP